MTPHTLTLQLHGPGVYMVELTVHDGTPDVHDGTPDEDAGESAAETDTPFGFTTLEPPNTQDPKPPDADATNAGGTTNGVMKTETCS